MQIGMMSQDDQILSEVIDKMAAMALERSSQADRAVEQFSAGVNRLMTWLPSARRREALELARAHGYCSPAEIERLHQENLNRH